MFSNFIYFIIVLLIYATYQPAMETTFTPIDTALLFAALHVLFVTYNRSLFQRLQHRVTRESFTRLDTGSTTFSRANRSCPSPFSQSTFTD